MFKVSIVGATGYTGLELLRMLFHHPVVEVEIVTSESHAGKKIYEVFPGLKTIYDKELLEFNADDIVENSDLVFVCLPHGASMEKVAELINKGAKVIDLSGDFRFKERKTYESWYHVEHRFSHLLEESVYGLTEVFREEISQARLVANPGCYATAVILALYPLIKEGVVKEFPVIADCKSGVTGGGRKLSQVFHFPECNESFMAYSVSGHRHNPEMEEVILRSTGIESSILFIPHLVPMNRGILATIYIKNGDISWEDVEEVYKSYYEKEPFIRLYPKGSLPSTKDVRGTNYCDIGWQVRREKESLIIISVIDNLVKGASGQAIQNMNVMLGIDEVAGLNCAPFWI